MTINYHKNSPYFKEAYNGLRPIVVALIIGAGILLIMILISVLLEFII